MIFQHHHASPNFFPEPVDNSIPKVYQNILVKPFGHDGLNKSSLQLSLWGPRHKIYPDW